MKHSKTAILFYLSRLPLLMLYLSFFSVQLFYNFDTGTRQLPINTIKIQKAGQSQLSAKAAGSGTTKDHFRLNKRYHPQPAITCAPVVITPVICKVSSKLHIHYSSGFIPSFFTPVYKLRGPPVIA